MSADGDRYTIQWADQVSDVARWLQAHGQRGTVVATPGAQPCTIWTPVTDPNASPRFARMGDAMVYAPDTGEVRVETP